MASATLRRRLHHGDVDGRKYERYDATDSESLSEPLLGSSEPLLGNSSTDNNSRDGYNEERTLEDIWEEERKRQQVHWTLIFSQLIAQWAQWIAKVVFGSGSLFGRFLFLPTFGQTGAGGRLLPPPLSMLQEERLRNIKRRIEIPFDGSRMEHQDALRQLWRLAYPQRELPPLKSELWKEMGWQGTDPSTDFRGGGYISLENLIFFAKTYPESFQRLLHKQDGTRAEWEYPFAVAGINISFMLAQMLDLQSGKPSTVAGIRFMAFLEEDEMAFDNLYCIAFQMMDAQWLAKRASYMEFNDVLKSTRAQLERELALDDVSSIRDLPAFNLLYK
ncbi:PREDICTED: ELMO domain-containing protein A [Camelina sativa]|uniref:ELMO domain-containing protein A n=1 Tax=Camelina sativa TaxID=90675 RepID=A0ABM1QZA2_CAMSA|nr:PREDICTED: ELMO domain-containing protein A [Camelina sativa]XP_010463814.1 PREDICTED: ELMO domain-containing protein A [Camelina sativa]XP_010463815.1 PREDICTED: ELMO domain-containing protein A [Camelina sativa]XP_019092090.1 PREDICTED: ELMO domain-containing protein A [Camelina sativa]